VHLALFRRCPSRDLTWVLVGEPSAASIKETLEPDRESDARQRAESNRHRQRGIAGLLAGIAADPISCVHRPR
jgi:hypothetical protein